jgi:hypothetical protein
MVRALWFWLNKFLDAKPEDQPTLSTTILDIFGNSAYFLRALQKY